MARSALKTIIVGISVAIVLSAALGFLLPIDPSLQEISYRTSVGPMDIVLASASGAAGALILYLSCSGHPYRRSSGGCSHSAVSRFWIAFRGRLLFAGFGCFFLFLANLISVNLAGVAIFLAQGI